MEKAFKAKMEDKADYRLPPFLMVVAGQPSQIDA